MPESVLHSPNPSNTKWNSRGTVSEKGLGKGAHCEVKAFTNYGGQYDVMLIQQDAFPCSDCDNFFIQKSQTTGKAIVFRVTSDGTGDRVYHVGKGLAPAAGYPCTIYYQAGARSYNAAPAAWPAAPPA
jgi:hypothetical protein